MNYISVIGSHSALQIIKGAKDENLKTILLCFKEREKFYRMYSSPDKIIIINKIEDLIKEEIQKEIIEAIFIPHGTLISEENLERFEKEFKPKVFGNRWIWLRHGPYVVYDG